MGTDKEQRKTVLRRRYTSICSATFYSGPHYVLHSVRLSVYPSRASDFLEIGKS